MSEWAGNEEILLEGKDTQRPLYKRHQLQHRRTWCVNEKHFQLTMTFFSTFDKKCECKQSYNVLISFIHLSNNTEILCCLLGSTRTFIPVLTKSLSFYECYMTPFRRKRRGIFRPRFWLLKPQYLGHRFKF